MGKQFKGFLFKGLILWLIIVAILAISIIRSCERSLTEPNEKTGKTLMRVIGEKTKKIKEEFDKGFKSDTLDYEIYDNNGFFAF